MMAWGNFTVFASLKKILAAFNLKFKVAGEGHCTLQVEAWETLFKKKSLDWSGTKQVAVLVCANMVPGQNR